MDVGSIADWFSGIMSAGAVIIALGGYWIADAQRKADQLDRDETAGRQLALKIMRVASLTGDIHRHVHSYDDAPPMGGIWGDQKWRRMQGLVGLRDEPTLALDGAQEVLLIKAKANKFLMDLMLSISRYQSLSATMQDYTVRRDAILALHPAPINMEGLHAVHTVDEAQFMQLLPYARALEAQAESLIEHADENRDLTLGLFEEYNETMAAYFKKTKMPGLTELPKPTNPPTVD
ncbi:hypothetical protein [Caulobacter sp. DWP3-1-3b2]|uniref:hypothetical protein n=1 Tax=Caulobacter sp. DWP3-1-3b2 TaxID=2804643 RepID=UPI003CECD72C